MNKALEFHGLPNFETVDNTTEAEQKTLKQLEDNKVDHASDTAREQLAMVREQNNYAVDKYKFQGQDELAKIRLGRLLHMNEFLRLLRKINPSFSYNDFSVRGLRGLHYFPHGYNQPPTYTGVAVQNGVAPEFESIYVDAHGLPGRSRYRGWRTVLLSLIKQNIISEAQATKVFGAAGGIASGRYLKELWEARNNKVWQ